MGCAAMPPYEPPVIGRQCWRSFFTCARGDTAAEDALRLPEALGCNKPVANHPSSKSCFP